MRHVHVRALALGASVLALILSACTTGGGGPTPNATTVTAPGGGQAAATAATKSPTAEPGAKPASAVPSPVASAASPVAAPTAAAGSPAAGGAAGTGAKPTVRVGSTNFTEQVILAELYGQVLEANGYRVERKLNLGSREIVFPALESNQIDLYPEYLATMLAFVTKSDTKEQDPARALGQLNETLRPRGIAVLDFAQAVDTNAFVVTRATADKFQLKTMSDVARVSNQLVLGGPPECPKRVFCLQGLEGTYGWNVKEFKPLDASGPITVAALEGGQVDVALLFSTDAAITQKGFVLLEDDKQLQAADNVAPAVRTDLLQKAPADFRTLVNGVSAKLTTANLTDLNKQVGVDRKEPRDVASAFLKAQGLVR